MSFRCQNCSGVNKTPKKIITQIRDKEYPVRKKGNVIIDKGGYGHEIVKEMIICESCYPNEKEE